MFNFFNQTRDFIPQTQHTYFYNSQCVSGLKTCQVPPGVVFTLQAGSLGPIDGFQNSVSLYNTEYSTFLERWQSSQFEVPSAFVTNNNGNIVGTWFLDIYPQGNCPPIVYFLVQQVGWPPGSPLVDSDKIMWSNNLAICYHSPTFITIEQAVGGFYTFGNFTQFIDPRTNPYANHIPISGVLP